MRLSKQARGLDHRPPLDVTERDDSQTIASAIAHAQALAREARKGRQGSAVDEFIAERRTDALKEDMEFNPEAHKAARLPE